MPEIQKEILRTLQKMEERQNKQLNAFSRRVTLLETEIKDFKQAQTALDEGLQNLAVLSESLLGRSSRFKR
ncbi:hypothetical protein [Halodesulfovibrio sp. MK-HDV]|uniref:hypothetical protein n=1 Tax=Halodesulfovibrio sp. MK-HDV TaxID=2599925 RepID=UPI00136891C5|nr:hypothetical protein [Halodesulfovibrio sp. MK-HDV]KAF1073933.1 hypothetical protein MKHDV_03273 [Halodesulfovibrio sp. MK-HDV]